MKHPPPEATSKQAYLEDLDRQVAAAHEGGAYTAVLQLAKQRRTDLQRDLAALLEGHELRVMTNEEWEESRRQWTPEKAQLNKRIAELHWQVREWSRVERIANMHAAKEALGWTILPDGTSAKVLDNGKDLSTYGGVRYEEEDGTIVDTSTRSDQWHRRHRKITSEFAMRVRSKRLAKARSRTRPSAHRRHCEHRPGFTRRASSSSSTSSSDPGDADPPARPVLSFAPAPRTILTFACLTAVERGEVEA